MQELGQKKWVSDFTIKFNKLLEYYNNNRKLILAWFIFIFCILIILFLIISASIKTFSLIGTFLGILTIILSFSFIWAACHLATHYDN